MTIAEILLTLSLVIALYYLLTPLQKTLEAFLLRLMGVEIPKSRIIDAKIIKEKKD